MMRKWEAPKLPPEGRFHYHQGVFLSGMYKSYELCKEEKYFDYIKSWVDAVITEDGVIKQADMGQFDVQIAECSLSSAKINRKLETTKGFCVFRHVMIEKNMNLWF